MTIPVFVPGMHIDDNGNLVIDADEAEARRGRMKDEQCSECSYYRGAHAYYCSHTTIDELRKSLMQALERENRNRTARDIQFRRMKELLTLWQGKFHALRHENNKLRRKIQDRNNAH